jgi:hypothetical protein
MATPAPFVRSASLTAIAVNFVSPDDHFIADEVLPRVDVMGRDFKWNVYKEEEIFGLKDTEVGRKGRVQEVEFGATELTDSIVDHGLEDAIPQTDIDQAADARRDGQSSYDPKARATEGTTHLLQIAREKRVADKVFSAASYPAGNKIALAGGDRFTDPTSDPIGVISDALDSTHIVRPNIGVIGQAGWTTLRQHPQIVKATNRNDGDAGMAARRAVAELFELDDIIVGRGFVNTAKAGQPGAFSRMWGNHLALIYRNRNADTQRGVTFGYTAQYGSKLAWEKFDENIGLDGGVRVRVGERVKELLVAAQTSYFIENL